jgi:hypothetical protein
VEPAVEDSERVRNPWARALYILFFGFCYGIAEVVIAAIVLVQLVMSIAFGAVNARLLRAGEQMTAYVCQLLLFVTFNSEKRPFPFADWPSEAPFDEVSAGEGSSPGDEPVETHAAR